MAVTIANFRIDFPQFASETQYPDANITRALERAAIQIKGIDSTDDAYDEGHALLAAHLMALGAIASASQGGNTGGIAAVNITGQGSVQYGQNPATRASSTSGYGATRYGVEYKEWLSRTVVAVRVH